MMSSKSNDANDNTSCQQQQSDDDDPVFIVESSPPESSTKDEKSPPTTMLVPRLCFGLYKVPDDDIGVRVVLDAIDVGYRHFDCAPIYGNEITFGKAFQQKVSSKQCDDNEDRLLLKRDEFYITSKYGIQHKNRVKKLFAKVL